MPRSGYQVFTFETNLGVIKVESDLSKTPCTAASIAYLASKGFYDNTSCHRLVPAIFALQCGDPAGTGAGGATYRFADENLPKDKLPAYHAGDVAMANQGQPDHQRQPVLLPLGRLATAGRLQPLGPGHRGPRHRQAGRRRRRRRRVRGRRPAAATRTCRSPSPR